MRGFIWDEPELTEDLSVLKDEGRDKSNIQLHLYESIFPFMRGSDEGWTAFISSIEAMFKDFPLTSFQVAIVNCSIVSFEQKWIDSARRKTKGTAVLSNQLKSNHLCHFWEPRDCFFCLWCIVNHNKSCCPCEMFAQTAEKTLNAFLGTVLWATIHQDWIFMLCFGIGILILEIEYFVNFLQLKCVILELSLLYWCTAYTVYIYILENLV